MIPWMLCQVVFFRLLLWRAMKKKSKKNIKRQKMQSIRGVFKTRNGEMTKWHYGLEPMWEMGFCYI